jgi:hypothetical protein
VVITSNSVKFVVNLSKKLQEFKEDVKVVKVKVVEILTKLKKIEI